MRTTPNQASSCSMSTSTVSSSGEASRASSARSDRVSTSSSSVSLASHPSSVRASSAAKYTVTLPLVLGVPVGGPPGGGYGWGVLCAEPHPLGIVTETERSGDVFGPLCPALLTNCRPSPSVALRLPPPADRNRLPLPPSHGHPFNARTTSGTYACAWRGGGGRSWRGGAGHGRATRGPRSARAGRR